MYDGTKERREMKNGNYDFEYHSLAEDADELYEDECYYDDGVDEPWVDTEQDDADQEIIEDNYSDYMSKYNAYYHDVADEIDD